MRAPVVALPTVANAPPSPGIMLGVPGGADDGSAIAAARSSQLRSAQQQRACATLCLSVCLSACVVQALAIGGGATRVVEEDERAARASPRVNGTREPSGMQVFGAPQKLNTTSIPGDGHQKMCELSC